MNTSAKYCITSISGHSWLGFDGALLSEGSVAWTTPGMPVSF